METKEILIEWGINVQNDNDIFECLSLTYPQHCYYIDRFPLLIKGFEKYEQEELYYKKVSKEIFTIEESKFVNIMKKIWLYNQVFVQTNLLEVPNDEIIGALNKNNNTIYILNQIIKNLKKGITVLENVDHLDLLIKLAVRESVYSMIIFLDQKILVISYGMCFQVYMHHLSSLQLVKTIVSTEGLYLRPYISL